MTANATIRFGIMADVHHDFSYRAEERLETFIRDMERAGVDFIVQLGDFCFPIPENRPFLQLWNRFPGPKYHVLGNHDMDRNDKRTVMDFWGMERNYYSFDCGAYHFVVLDPNHMLLDGKYEDYAFGNYHKHRDAINHLSPDQLEWLERDLAATDKTTIVFSHQNLESPYNDFNYGIHNADAFRAVLRGAKRADGSRKVVACMNGHNHLDGVKVIDDTYYIHINSMSYFYMGRDYKRVRYSEEVSERYPILAISAPYRDPLYAIVTVEPGVLRIEGRETEFVGPSPLECGHKNSSGGHPVTAVVSDRTLKY
ncbi:metallophosphoesterase family protein [Paenibacillus flagellatus]|uniref:Metallophosphoesterase n=1 Tax=Paenibacillus flagellatus TaxID=2211139 RepID=A0A2V5K9G4_9BACL|nr:metallophosphoesterase [Paenibacillus flagellatus]PYI56165.1 metallophosphoesterase [Paenibacillus flagellatus]